MCHFESRSQVGERKHVRVIDDSTAIHLAVMLYAAGVSDLSGCSDFAVFTNICRREHSCARIHPCSRTEPQAGRHFAAERAQFPRAAQGIWSQPPQIVVVVQSIHIPFEQIPAGARPIPVPEATTP